MKKILFCGIVLMSLVLGSCSHSPALDTSKLDTAYFVGVYQTNYRNEIEKIILKDSSYYDYAYGKNNDTIIKDAGKWRYNKEQAYIYLKGFPSIRKKEVYEEEKGKVFDIMLNIDIISGLGDLYAIDHEENRYTFVKLDKSKNNNYILKK